MKKIKTLLILSTLSSLILSASSQAGQRSGSGGDAVVCRNSAGRIQSAEVFDLFEGRMLHGLTFPPSAAGAPYLARIEGILARLRKFDPVRADRYLEQARAFEANAQFLRDVTLRDVQDSLEEITPLPRGCALEQAAIRRAPQAMRSGDKKYLLDGDIWDAFPEDSKAGLVLHEIAYEDAQIANSQMDSRNARYFIAVISSSRFDTETDWDYLDLLQETGMLQTAGVMLRLGTLVFPAKNVEYEDAVLTIRDAGPYVHRYSNGTLTLGGNLQYSRRDHSLVAGSVQRLTPIQTSHGEIEILGTVTFDHETLVKAWVPRPTELITPFGKLSISAEITFYRGGQIKTVNVRETSQFSFQGLEVPLSPYSRLHFDEAGQPLWIVIDSSVPIRRAEISFDACGHIQFHRNGQIARTRPCVQQGGFFSPKKATVRIQGRTLALHVPKPHKPLESADETETYFHPNGLPSDVTVRDERDLTLTLVTGKEVALQGGKSFRIRLDESGNVLDVKEVRKD